MLSGETVGSVAENLVKSDATQDRDFFILRSSFRKWKIMPADSDLKNALVPNLCWKIDFSVWYPWPLFPNSYEDIL